MAGKSAKAGAAAARALAGAERAVHALMFPEVREKCGPVDTAGRQYFHRVWATRKPLWADQLASAWLIRRFIDPEATLLWLDAETEMTFDLLYEAYFEAPGKA